MPYRRITVTGFAAIVVVGGLLLNARGGDITTPVLPSAADASQSDGFVPPVLPPAGMTAAPAGNAMDAPADTPGVVLPMTPGLTPQQVTPGANPFAASPAMPMAAPNAAASVPGANPFLVPNAPAGGAAAPLDAKPFAPAISVAAPATAPTAQAAAPATTTPPTAGGKSTVDVSALRYYASQHDLQRVGAEIRRLKELNPGWQPPADLFAPVSTVNEQPLWDLFAAGQYSAERAKIAELKTANPSWMPSTDLMTKLGNAEAALAFKTAYVAGNWQQVISAAAAHSSVLVCSNIDSLWMLGEALARLRNYAQSFEAYKYILANCTDPAQRLSTVQKAALLLPQQGIDALVAMGHPVGDGTMEFDSVAFQPLRTALNDAIDNGVDAAPIDPAALTRFAAYIGTTQSASDMGLLGWYYYGQEEWDAARAWFTAGARISPDPKLIEGEILALRGDSRNDAAMKLAKQYRSRSPGLTTQYIELTAALLTDPKNPTTLGDEDMQRFQNIVTQAKSALGAQAVGWSFINENDLDTAKTWLDTSMSWGTTEGGVIGQAVIASRLKQYGTLSALKAKYTAKYPGLAKFKVYSIRPSRSQARTAPHRQQPRAARPAASSGPGTPQQRAACASGNRLGVLALLACPQTPNNGS